jgi:hypothetical protein
LNVRTTLPAVAFTVRVAGPVAALEVADSFKVVLPLPGAGRLAGAKVAVTPEGCPWTANVTAELKPPNIAVVRLTDTVLPRLSERAVVTLGDTVMAGTSRVKVAVLVTPPPVAVTVNG